MVNTDSYLALDTQLIPESTKQNLTGYDALTFSNDGRYLLTTGYHENGDLTHPSAVLFAWIGWEPANIQQSTIIQIMSNSIEYTREEILTLQADPSSIWYLNQELGADE